jgi:hypothetical protein
MGSEKDENCKKIRVARGLGKHQEGMRKIIMGVEGRKKVSREAVGN